MSADAKQAHWIFCQLGARRDYHLPVQFQRHGQLELLVTDLWFPQTSRLSNVSPRFARRSSPELPRGRVLAANWSLAVFETAARLAGCSGWKLVCARNSWFQRRAARTLHRMYLPPHIPPANGSGLVVHTSCYTALRILRVARRRGWFGVIDQIDPGPAIDRIQLSVCRRAAEAKPDLAPQRYWQEWRAACRFADAVIVNSDWSRRSILSEGVPGSKIHLIPLSYQAGCAAARHRRQYPRVFDAGRPLRALFLGHVTPLKGIFPLIEAIDAMNDCPVTLDVVGAIRCHIPNYYLRHPRIRWHGVVAHADTNRHYQTADVFIFPSFCDGFGLTQLEAQSWGLPVMASPYCGDVVAHGFNGVRLEEVSSSSIAAALASLAASPHILQRMSDRAGIRDPFTPEAEVRALMELNLLLRCSRKSRADNSSPGEA